MGELTGDVGQGDDGTGPGEQIVWGRRNDVIQFALLSTAEWVAGESATNEQALTCETWAEVRAVLGPDAFEADFGQQMDDLWADEYDGPGDPPDRPEGWMSTDDVPDLSGDWLSGRPRIDDPNLLDGLPAWLFDFTRGSASPMSGDFVWWDESDLAEIQQAADEHGCQLVRRDDLIDQ